MDATRRSRWPWLRLALVGFVLAWILGPDPLRDSFPILLVFVLALGLEVQFLVSALRGGGPARAPDRGPQPVDREWYGFDGHGTDNEGEEDGQDESYEEDEEDGQNEEDEEDWYARAPRARPLRSFATGIAVITALVVAVVLVGRDSGWAAVPGDRRAEAVARFSEEASRIAEKPVSIRCDEGRDYVGAVQHADGVAVVGGDLAIVTPEVCNDLYRLAFEHETDGAHTGRALAVLAHESWHLRGEADESTAECFALQSGVTLGQRLGLSEGRALQLMREQRIENALRGADTLEYRLTSECRDGGRLDLDQASGTFP